jgi:hypothetical protein
MVAKVPIARKLNSTSLENTILVVFFERINLVSISIKTNVRKIKKPICLKRKTEYPRMALPGLAFGWISKKRESIRLVNETKPT